jgi:hypothetical protein
VCGVSSCLWCAVEGGNSGATVPAGAGAEAACHVVFLAMAPTCFLPLTPFHVRSVLEPGRSLTLAEKGGAGAEFVVAHPAFRIAATMNPGATRWRPCCLG